jgi:DNA polymerase-3 subunit gamma/tau
MELYKKYRPKTLDAVVGNESTISALQNMIARKTLPQAILLHGPSGCGKTTIGRILKDELECLDIDFCEMNSSSFRGIDSIRDVCRNMNLAPSGPCRIWFFDEVHKWTADAQDASLKMLEDTPARVYFFLCTTDPNKLKKAILTRCCEMPVRALTYNELEGLAQRVARREKITLSKDTLDSLVASADGSARMLLVLLDKIANLDQAQQASAIAQKLSEENEAIDLCRMLIKQASWKSIAEVLKNLKGDPEGIRRAVLGYARQVLLGAGGSDSKTQSQAFMILQAFSENLYNTGDAGLVKACYEAIVAS